MFGAITCSPIARVRCYYAWNVTCVGATIEKGLGFVQTIEKGLVREQLENPLLLTFGCEQLEDPFPLLWSPWSRHVVVRSRDLIVMVVRSGIWSATWSFVQRHTYLDLQFRYVVSATTKNSPKDLVAIAVLSETWSSSYS